MGEQMEMEYEDQDLENGGIVKKRRSVMDGLMARRGGKKLKKMQDKLKSEQLWSRNRKVDEKGFAKIKGPSTKNRNSNNPNDDFDNLEYDSDDEFIDSSDLYGQPPLNF